MLVPLAIINHFKPTRHPANISLDELYPAGYHERDMALARDPQIFTMRNFFIELDKLHKGEKSLRSHLRSIKDFHRNPLMHPEQSLETVDEALDLLAAIRSSRRSR